MTGGASGIGLSISKSLLEAKYDLIVQYNTANENLEHLRIHARRFRRSIHFVQVDFQIPEEMRILSDFVKQQTDVLHAIVFCAGSNEKVSFKDIDAAAVDRVFAVNAKAPILLTHHLLPLLMTPHSSILCIGSSYAYIGGSAESVLYTASKAALIGFIRTITRANIVRANMIVPGFIDAPSLYSRRMLQDIEGKEKNIPLGRLGTPQEIADLACFLLSDRAAYITGQEIHANGGVYFG